MAKDPAFLFYPGDWLGGTMTFNRHHKGAYMDVLMAQFNQGHLSIDEIKTVLGVDFDLWDLKLKQKFVIDCDGKFYNKKLDEEIVKRKNFTQSRRDNLSHKDSHMVKHMDEHMENENENKDIIKKERIVKENHKKKFDFESVWFKYPKKIGRQEALGYFNMTVKTDEDFENIKKAMDNYLGSERVFNGMVQDGRNWFAGWQDWINHQEKVCSKCKGRGKFTSSTGFEFICDCPKGRNLK